MPDDLLGVHWESEALGAEELACVYREMVLVSWEALRDAKLREASLQGQLSACREELRQARQQVMEMGG